MVPYKRAEAKTNTICKQVWLFKWTAGKYSSLHFESLIFFGVLSLWLGLNVSSWIMVKLPTVQLANV